MRTTFRASVGTVLLVLVATGCDGIFDLSGEEQQLGVIEFDRDRIHVEVPDTVVAGRDFTILVRTWGGGCTREGPTDVSVEGLRVVVVPYDIESGAEACTAILRAFDHEATVRLGRAGTASITVRGYSRPEDRTITIERTVVVE